MSATFEAEIRLADQEAGGRAGPLFSGEWSTVLGLGQEHGSARLRCSGSPSPGEVFHASVQLLVPEALALFPVGIEFTVWDGGTTGRGRVLGVSPQDGPKSFALRWR